MDPQAMEAGGAGGGNNLTSYERNLYLYHEECPERPRVATLLSSLADYDVAIPANAGEDPPPATKVSLSVTRRRFSRWFEHSVTVKVSMALDSMSPTNDLTGR